MKSVRLMATVLVLLVATGTLRADEAEERAVKAVRELGGVVWRDEQAPGQPVVRVLLGGSQVTDAALKEVAAFKNLQTLNLPNTAVTDAGLKELATLTNLQTLDLYGTTVTAVGLKELAPLGNLQSLNLTGR